LFCYSNTTPYIYMNSAAVAACLSMTQQSCQQQQQAWLGLLCGSPVEAIAYHDHNMADVMVLAGRNWASQALAMASASARSLGEQLLSTVAGAQLGKHPCKQALHVLEVAPAWEFPGPAAAVLGT
jgi:hypothetical protein